MAGNVDSGPRDDYFFIDKPINNPSNMALRTNGFEFGNTYCLGLSSKGHLSLSNKKTGKKSVIFREDGYVFNGSRDDYNCWTWNYPNIGTIDPNMEYIQFNNEFRIIQLDSGHSWLYTILLLII